MKIACLQLNATIGDFEGNARRLLEAYRKACQRGADIAVSPETIVSGYPPRDLLNHADFVAANEATVTSIASATGSIPLVAGFITRNPGQPGKALFNSAGFLRDGKIRHLTHKRLLPSYDVFDEGRYFESGGPGEPIEFQGRCVGARHAGLRQKMRFRARSHRPKRWHRFCLDRSDRRRGAGTG